MNILRNRFLGTAAALLAPADKPNDGKDTTLTENVGAEDDTGAAGNEDASEDTTAGDEDAGDEDAGGADEDAAAASEEDDDPDLADLPPEVKAKAKAAIAKRVAAETGWRDRQIDKLHARRRSAEEDTRAMGAIAERRAAPAAPDAAKTYTDADVKAEAQRIAAQDKYDRDANDADAAGKKTYGDKWGKTLAQLPKLGGLDVTDMVDILNTDQPHVVLFNLSDPTEYERVMSLPPARRRNEFVKLSLKEAPKPRAADSKRPSDATAPVTPVTGGRRVAAQQVNLADDKTPDDAWYAARNATRRKKFSDHV